MQLTKPRRCKLRAQFVVRPGEDRSPWPDPNWGGSAAAGRSVALDPDAVALWIGPHQLMAAGQPVAFDRAAASNVLRQEHVPIRLGLGHGSGAGQAWGCDLSDQYVRINADYTT